MASMLEIEPRARRQIRALPRDVQQVIEVGHRREVYERFRRRRR